MGNAYFSIIGRRGGFARIHLHGNPGTAKGRRRGGLASLKTHIKNHTGFKTLRAIKVPRHSTRLAELVGIFMGDGHIGKYQASVTTNSETDFDHALFVQDLIEDLFKIPVSMVSLPKKKACVMVVSSRAFCRFMTTQGIPQGNKIVLGVHVPQWIQENTSYQKAFIRGLFDTDGCVYIDTHAYKMKSYKNIGMAFANQSIPLLSFFKNSLEQFGLHPTQKTDFRVFLRRREDIRTYFDLFGSSNKKHLRKVHKYLRLSKGGVA